VIDATVALGELDWRRGDLDTASQRWQEALALARESGKSDYVPNVQCWLVYAACAQGDYDRADELGRASLEGYVEHQVLERGKARLALARVALFRGEPARAVELYRASLTGLWPADRVGTVNALEGLSWALAADGQYREATQLLAIAARERDDIGMVLPPVERPHHEQAMAAVRDTLDEAAFAIAWAEGEALDLEEALALALGNGE
jgi:ATP/maltotriose-dependent transcriptional regulator MalT